jgi:thiamine biosynthesis lipoprotein
MIIPALFVGALFAIVILRQPEAPGAGDTWVIRGPSMGTQFMVKVVPPEIPEATEVELGREVEDVIDTVNLAMSTWLDDSELSRFNRHGTEPFPASGELVEVVAEAQRVAELTGGALDITVGPLVDAWGFGPTEVNGPPTTDTIDALLAATGFELLEVDPSRQLLRKAVPTLRCDLSAIAKGYAVDRVAERLHALGFDDFMVEIGGEVRASGRNPQGEVWRIGIERPEMARGGVWSAVALDDAALATSGDYRNFYIRDGVRISHTLDPRTGRPITHDLASVSVIDPSCMTADALATAINVLGPVEGRALVERENLPALFIFRTGDDELEEWTSPAWRERLANIGKPNDVDGGESE